MSHLFDDSEEEGTTNALAKRGAKPAAVPTTLPASDDEPTPTSTPPVPPTRVPNFSDSDEEAPLRPPIKMPTFKKQSTPQQHLGDTETEQSQPTSAGEPTSLTPKPAQQQAALPPPTVENPQTVSPPMPTPPMPTPPSSTANTATLDQSECISQPQRNPEPACAAPAQSSPPAVGPPLPTPTAPQPPVMSPPTLMQPAPIQPPPAVATPPIVNPSAPVPQRVATIPPMPPAEQFGQRVQIGVDLPRIEAAPQNGTSTALVPLGAPPMDRSNPAANMALQVTTQNQMENHAWEAFTSLRKQLEESHNRTSQLHQEISRVQLAHEKEAAEAQNTANAQTKELYSQVEQLTEVNSNYQAKMDNLTTVLSRKAEQIIKLEQKLHEATAQHAAMTQRVAHVDDRAKLAEKAKMVAEARMRELELSLEHTASLVSSMRKQLSSAQDDKAEALQNQYKTLEQNRNDLVMFYADRENKILESYNVSLQQVHQQMENAAQHRESVVAGHWRALLEEQRMQCERLEGAMKDMSLKHLGEMQAHRDALEAEKTHWMGQYREEMTALEKRMKDREENLNNSMSKRERDLGDREQKLRVQHAKELQDSKVKLLSREAELKAHYDAKVEELRKQHDDDRNRTSQSFRDQIGQLSEQHRAQERELERLHREKEREMAQRYRISGYEIDDARADISMKTVSSTTTGALLSKFDKIEARQKERASANRTTMSSAASGGSPPPNS